MVRLEEWGMIKALRQQGLSISEIARRVGKDRKTVRKVLKSSEYRKYKRSEKAKKLITPYMEYIKDRIAKYNLRAKRLYREIREQGYKGSYETVKNYVRSIKDLRPKPAYIRYETLPGEQAQVDWGHMKRIRPDGLEEEVYCFSFVLGYSRALYKEYTEKRDLLTFMRCHQRAFEYVGGVPAKILYDHVKTVVLKSLGKEHIWNESFMDFARFYGFKPDLCNVGEAHEKGKVEKVLDYIEKDFFIGTEWEGLDELNQKGLKWLNEVANVRVHGTTGEIPFERLKKEERLVPVGGRGYEVFLREPRKVSKDCYISYKGNRYSVPHKYSLRQVMVKIYEEELKVYFGHELIATHRIAQGRGETLTEPSHFEGLPQRKATYSIKGLREEFVRSFEGAEGYVLGLTQEKGANLRYHLEKILALREDYAQDEISEAVKLATRYGAYGYKFVHNILIQKKKGYTPPLVCELTIKYPWEYNYEDVAQRPLRVYEELVGA